MLIANTKKQALHEHLYAVAVLARHIATFKTSNLNIQQCCFVAGLFSGVGKIDPALQGQLAKGTKLTPDGEHIASGRFAVEKHARHHELSTWTFALMSGADRESKKQFLKRSGFASHDIRLIDIIKHGIYWHHAKPLRKQELQKLGHIQQQSIPEPQKWCAQIDEMMQQLNALCPAISKSWSCLEHRDISDVIEDISKEPLPAYKQYQLSHAHIHDYHGDIHYNSCCNIVRSSVICAKKIIAALSRVELSEVIKDDKIERLFLDREGDATLNVGISRQASTFYQTLAAQTLAKQEGVATLSVTSHVEKLHIALAWARERQAEKLYWVVPRVSVGLDVYETLSGPDLLPDCRIEIFTGDHKLTRHQGIEAPTNESDYLSGHIVITTIDQLTNAISTRRQIDVFTDFMLHHAVFDEFHELFHIEGLNVLFTEIIHGKMRQAGPANALLASATPNYTACSELLNIHVDRFVEMPSLNTNRYAVEQEDFSNLSSPEQHPLYRAVPDDSMVICNTATRAQLSYLQRYEHESSLLLHGRLASEDKRDLLKDAVDSFGPHGTQRIKVLRATSIVQNTLNITCQLMISEASTPENMMQRLGRLGRLRAYSGVNRLIVAIPASVRSGKITDNEARFLHSVNMFRTTVAWTDFLSSQVLADVRLHDLYRLYKEFHQTSKGREAVQQDLSAALKRSAQIIAVKLCDPLDVEPKENVEKTLKRVSLRGDSRYVQMILASYQNGQLTLENRYALSPDNTLTLNVGELDVDSDSPLIFMSRKHHYITGVGTKYDNSPTRLKELARHKETPIFTSYAPADLAVINEVNQPSALVYVVTEKQWVGCMRLQQLRDTISTTDI